MRNLTLKELKQIYDGGNNYLDIIYNDIKVNTIKKTIYKIRFRSSFNKYNNINKLPIFIKNIIIYECPEQYLNNLPLDLKICSFYYNNPCRLNKLNNLQPALILLKIENIKIINQHNKLNNNILCNLPFKLQFLYFNFKVITNILQFMINKTKVKKTINKIINICRNNQSQLNNLYLL